MLVSNFCPTRMSHLSSLFREKLDHYSCAGTDAYGQSPPDVRTPIEQHALQLRSQLDDMRTLLDVRPIFYDDQIATRTDAHVIRCYPKKFEENVVCVLLRLYLNTLLPVSPRMCTRARFQRHVEGGLGHFTIKSVHIKCAVRRSN